VLLGEDDGLRSIQRAKCRIIAVVIVLGDGDAHTAKRLQWNFTRVGAVCNSSDKIRCDSYICDVKRNKKKKSRRVYFSFH
jgi:hypothetical protein